MDKLTIRAEDKYVAVRYIYNKSNDSYAYADAECTTKLTTSELKNAFLKGAVIVLAEDAGLAKPIQYSESESVGSVAYIVPNGTTATSADIASLSGVADPA
ncbi:MAG: hypothetical protein J6Y02_21745 [Pseudobutyrivibrio sp.]|nr:hypothetical protein [Pseudobutyrivibrio sp.]